MKVPERAEKTGSGKWKSRPKSEKSARKSRETGSQGAAMPDLTYETIDKNYESKKINHLLFIKNRSKLIHDKNADFVMKGFTENE